jgi:AP2 domain/HNH endonuclease
MITMHCTDGTPFTIDEEDFEFVSSRAWYSNRSRRATYVITVDRPSKDRVSLHRLLLDAPEGRMVDHIDGNGLNNTRGNLRLCSAFENQHNTRLRLNNTSGYKGVDWHRRSGRWRARVRVNHKTHHLGLYDTPEQAAEVARAFREKVHGEFANHG